MDEFHQSFFEDSRELLSQLESALLSLESNPQDKEIIEEIFRVMHTIKGAANMFGFEQIGQFTHDIETIYDAIRNHEIVLDNLVLETTFRSVDHIYALLEDPELSDEDNHSTHEKLLKQVQDIIDEIEKSKKSQQTTAILEVEENEKEIVWTYYINIRPHEAVDKVSGHPVSFIIEDIIEQGQNKIKEHVKAEDQNKVIYWDIYLATSLNEEGIRNLFLFVEDECQIEVHKLVSCNILAEEAFVKKTEEIEEADIPVDIEYLQNYINELLAEIRDHRLHQIDEKKDKPSDNNKTANQSASIRVATDKIDRLVNLVSELITLQATLQSVNQIQKLPQLESITENLELISNNLRDTIFSISLLPLDTMTVRLKRLVRTLSQELNKEVKFITEGVDTELDKNIIEVLSDPLIHILRNCMDHGLETAEEREAAGKSTEGRITLRAYHSGANIHIEIEDDGRGINIDTIRTRAIQKKLISSEEVLSPEQTYELLFKPGFSTAEKVTDVSGRGVGMDVVRKKIREVRGDISIQSELGQGTKMTIRLPMSLSIIDGLLTEVDGSFFVLPLNLVMRIDEIPYQQTNLDGKLMKTLAIADKQLPVLSIRDAFGLKESTPDMVSVVNVQNGEEVRGIVVDEVKGEIQAVLKPLGSMYSSQDYLSGSTILGDGNIAFVLDANKLMTHFSN